MNNLIIITPLFLLASLFIKTSIEAFLQKRRVSYFTGTGINIITSYEKLLQTVDLDLEKPKYRKRKGINSTSYSGIQIAEHNLLTNIYYYKYEKHYSSNEQHAYTKNIFSTNFPIANIKHINIYQPHAM